jgi:TonB-dependent SusC/RagA subfamily outer membrane receptor
VNLKNEKIMLRYFILFIGLGLFSMCSSSRQGQSSVDTSVGRNVGKTEAISEVETDNSALQLVDYLRRIPGVQVSGSRDNPIIRVRVSSSVQSDVEPLFVIDRTVVGNSYQSAASMVDVNDIQSVRVLKDVSSTSMYGMQGANGVILIKTKK